MDTLLHAQMKLVPELMDVLVKRYRTLMTVYQNGPIGRRSLSEINNLSERETRTILDTFRTEQLIDVGKDGATITNEGISVLKAMAPFVEGQTSRSGLAKNLTERLGIRGVHIVQGDCDESTLVKEEMGSVAAHHFLTTIKPNSVVAVTGGSSVATISSFIGKTEALEQLLFIAARGGVGENIGLQANVIAASFANAVGGTYKTFYYPEVLSEEVELAFRKDPAVQEMLQLYEKTDYVIHGIGHALKMATVRKSTENELNELQQLQAVGEAFGYYMNAKGEVVHRIRSVGIQLEQLQRVPKILAIAGGASKADAILAYLASAPRQTVLVTDEGAAQKMLEQLVQ